MDNGDSFFMSLYEGRRKINVQMPLSSEGFHKKIPIFVRYWNGVNK